jgi:hypothetical protein
MGVSTLSRGAPVGMRITQKDLAEAEDLDFSEEKEYWNEYRLNDGTLLKVKLVLEGVKRLNKHLPDGMPVYLVRSRNIVRTLEVSEKLKAKTKESTFRPV